MGTKTINLGWTQLATGSGNDEFQPVTGWMSARNIGSARVSWEIASIEGTTTVTPGYQSANSADSPEAPASLGDGETTKDVFYPAAYQDLKSALQDAQIVRFGFFIKSTGGVGFARAGGGIDVVER